MTPEITWQISVDWNNDGDFSDSGEDITAYVMNAQWRLGFDQPFMSVADENTCELVLKNSDRRFSPENSSGPYYGNLLPHRPVRIFSTVTTYQRTHWRGWVESIHPTVLQNGEQVAILRAHGAKRFLDDATVYLPLMENVTADEIILKILEQVALPPIQGQAWVLGASGFSELGSTTILAEVDDALIRTGQTNFPYVGDTFDQGMTAYEAIYAVTSTERGRFFYNREGRNVFWDRQYLQTNETNWATFDDTLLDADYGYGEDMYNVVEVVIRPRALSSSVNDALWSLDEALVLKAGQERTIRAQFASEEGAQIAGRNVQLPSGVDFVADTGISLAGFNASATSAEITVRNNTTADGEVTTIVVRGQKLTAFKPQTITAVDAESVALYGRRVLTIDAGMLSDASYAYDMANYLLGLYKDPRGALRKVRLANKNTALAVQMQLRQIGERVTIDETQTAHSRQYVIMGQRHELREGLKVWLCEWTLEPAAATDGWILGQSGRSELGSTTKLGF